MNEGGSSVGSAQAPVTARVIHAAISGAVVVVLLVFAFLRGQIGLEAAPETVRILRIVGYVVAFSGVVMAGMLRGRIAPRPREMELGGWWIETLPKAVVVWAMSEGGGLTGMVLGWLLGDVTLLTLSAAAALAALFVTRPGRLQGTT